MVSSTCYALSILSRSLNHSYLCLYLGCDTSRRHLASLENSLRYADGIRNDYNANRLCIEENLFYSRRVSIPPETRIWTISEQEEHCELLAITAPPNSPLQADRPCTSRAAMADEVAGEVEDEVEELSQRTRSQLSIKEEADSSSTEIDDDDDDDCFLTDRQPNECSSERVSQESSTKSVICVESSSSDKKTKKSIPVCRISAAFVAGVADNADDDELLAKVNLSNIKSNNKEDI